MRATADVRAGRNKDALVRIRYASICPQNRTSVTLGVRGVVRVLGIRHIGTRIGPWMTGVVKRSRICVGPSWIHVDACMRGVASGFENPMLLRLVVVEIQGNYFGITEVAGTGVCPWIIKVRRAPSGIRTIISVIGQEVCDFHSTGRSWPSGPMRFAIRAVTGCERKFRREGCGEVLLAEVTESILIRISLAVVETYDVVNTGAEKYARTAGMWILLDTPELTCDAGCRCRCCLLRGQAIARTGELSSCDQRYSQKQVVLFHMIH